MDKTDIPGTFNAGATLGPVNETNMARIWNHSTKLMTSKHKQPLDPAQGKANTPLKRKVFVGISGGVDSSVALAMLQTCGYDVTGVFLKVWNPDFLPCTWRDERRSAMRVCATLGVPFMTFDCEKEYKELVVDYMLSEYKAGRTPNPDVFCNKYIKFGVFLKKAIEMGADFVATGHYAQISLGNASGNLPEALPREMPREIKLIESTDKDKDQSYFLHQLNQEQLSHTLFPIGHLQKSQVRELARKFGLSTAEKKDSQGLCFIGKVDMKDFLAHYIKAKPGNVLNETGEIIGRHDGAVFYTIGERHGPGSRAKLATGQALRLYVVAKDIEKNTITVSANYTNKIEYTNKNQKSIKIKNVNWISDTEPDSRNNDTSVGLISKKYDVRFRYGQEKQKCSIKCDGNNYEIIPDIPQFGIAPGQSAVIYSGEVCLGGGIIE